MTSFAWLDEVVPVDPLLAAPLGLDRAQAPRRDQIEALLGQLGLVDRVDSLSDTTCQVVEAMFDGLAAARGAESVRLKEYAELIARGSLPSDLAGVQALLDFGWGDHPLHEVDGEAQDIVKRLRALYVSEMAKRLRRMLRAWENARWVHDADSDVA